MDFMNCRDLPVWAEILLKETSPDDSSAEEALPDGQEELRHAA